MDTRNIVTPSTIENARRLVRESAYNVCQLYAAGRIGEDYSRAVCLYHDACEMLGSVDPDNSREFIAGTYHIPNSAEASHKTLVFPRHNVICTHCRVHDAVYAVTEWSLDDRSILDSHNLCPDCIARLAIQED